MVRELSKHQSAFLFDCCIVIARFASLSCYSSAKTRIRPVKLYKPTPVYLGEVSHHMHDSGESNDSSICHTTHKTCSSVCQLHQPSVCHTTNMMCLSICDRIPSTNPGAEPPRDARDSGSARSHSMHIETSSSDRP